MDNETFFSENIREGIKTLKDVFKGGKNLKCGLVIGHKPNKPGACNKTHQICEYQFNDQLASDIYDYLKENDENVRVVLIRRRTYKELPDDINHLEPNFCISLHCNAAAIGYSGKWGGTETLYYHSSKRGKMIAEILQKNIVDTLGFRDRGILPRGTEDRGGYLLKYTDMPCVITEPFFIDNDEEYKTVQIKYNMLVKTYAKCILKIADTIKCLKTF